MSKKKKKTLDELLEESLVPEDEQPYEVPDNWIWLKFNDVFETLSNSSGAIKLKDYNSEGNYPIIDQSASEIGGYTDLKDLLYNGDLPVIIFGDHTKNIKWVDYKFAQGADGTKLLSTKTNPLNKYYYYCLKQIKLPDKGYSRHFKFLKEVIIPVAPLKEQKRIADKIEILFDELDEAEQLIEGVKETFYSRRNAILDMAFRGWKIRGDNNLPKGWEYRKFKDIANVKSNLVNPLDFLNYPHIAPDNIEKNTGRLLPYRTIQEDGVKSSKHYFEKGSILYSKIRPYLSKVIIADFDGLCSADMYPIESELTTEYLYWYMLSPMFLEQATTAGSRSVLPKINQKELGEILVPVCSIEHQIETVNKLNKLLQEESLILNYIENSKRNFEELKQSILSKAFKGELGTNDSTDEPAIELLKSILQETL